MKIMTIANVVYTPIRAADSLSQGVGSTLLHEVILVTIVISSNFMDSLRCSQKSTAVIFAVVKFSSDSTYLYESVCNDAATWIIMVLFPISITS